ncbi:hypothetical protein G9Q38_07315 [Pusillimonas sp. DMV24BSW_D]|uniref:hypothetical protein n=1 Tax=Neopusillimonas aestuarii TaxID=2716226 RepID=UPI00140D579B|nr:hypothetical protein [Pusillimonas sp. DMV24BSW_D]QIM49003.1 hypothetical protein G9Q38_07315 [Pusillimonas sp. DMV24BSW_D]
MKYYKKFIPEKWQVYAYEADGSQDDHIGEEMIPITVEEAKEIASAEKDHVALDILRAGSTERNWRWPPKAYQEAIGQIAVCSSSLEVLIRTAIWHVANLDSSVGRAFTGKARIGELCEMLKALIEIKAPHLKDDVAQITSQIKEAFTRRAIYIHQVWSVKDGLPAVGKLFIERYERLENLSPVSLSDMYKLADDMHAVEGRIMSQIIAPLLPQPERGSN